MKTNITRLFLAISALVANNGVHGFVPVVHRVSSQCIEKDQISVSKGRNDVMASLSMLQFGDIYDRQKIRSVLQASINKNGDDENIPGFSINPIPAILWLTLVAWTFTVAPGELGSPGDAAMVDAIIADPINPGINTLYYTLFNVFALLPLILAALILPEEDQSNKERLPAAPFVVLSAFLGYFALGPYLSFRDPPRTTYTEVVSQGGWYTRNVAENKVVAWLVVALTAYLPVGCGLVGALATQDPLVIWQNFLDLAGSSRFVAVSLVDLVLLYGCSIALTSRDYLLRKPKASEAEARNVALASATIPYLGTALYVALRPKLPIGTQV